MSTATHLLQSLRGTVGRALGSLRNPQHRKTQGPAWEMPSLSTPGTPHRNGAVLGMPAWSTRGTHGNGPTGGFHVVPGAVWLGGTPAAKPGVVLGSGGVRLPQGKSCRIVSLGMSPVLHHATVPSGAHMAMGPSCSPENPRQWEWSCGSQGMWGRGRPSSSPVMLLGP